MTTTLSTVAVRVQLRSGGVAGTQLMHERVDLAVLSLPHRIKCWIIPNRIQQPPLTLTPIL